MPHDLDFAASIIVAEKSSIDKWRAQNFVRLIEICKANERIDDTLEQHRSTNSSIVSSHLRLGRILIAAESCAWPDRTVSEMLTSGARPLGIEPH